MIPRQAPAEEDEQTTEINGVFLSPYLSLLSLTHPSMEDLPADVMIHILSRLPVKTIIHCKFVCKKWRNLVLDSSFVSLHLSKSPTGLIIHHNPANKTDDLNVSKDPGILNWVEIEDEVDNHHFHHDPLMTFHLNLAPILQNSLIHQVGSVNGLICLRQYKDYPKFDNIYICNPITREYMILPVHPCYTQGYVTIVHGFGVSSLTGEYKVVRTSHWDLPPNQSYEPNGLEIEVYTLGTAQWRSVGHFPYGIGEFYGPNTPFLNNHCHWIVYDKEDELEKLCSFDLDKETFQLFPSPPPENIEEPFHSQSLAVLKGCICKLDTYGYESQLTIWVMKEYGIKESWYKEVVIKQAVSPNLDWLMWEPIHVIEGLKDGSILTLCDNKLWAFYPRSETIEDTEMFECFMSGLTYRPSFLKLSNFESERVLMF